LWGERNRYAREPPAAKKLRCFHADLVGEKKIGMILIPLMEKRMVSVNRRAANPNTRARGEEPKGPL
jgi:hypothetical protein